ncbi:unnamed protein product, partial [Mesorhabditis belari]|uniref:Uncharacterized protein n=1 Tax=Mesorhabditis belari TaxID=2138241 RepID=A0AAF3EX26_9BILA
MKPLEEGSLLDDEAIVSRRGSRGVPVCELGNHQRMAFLRKYFFTLFFQAVTCTLVSAVLFLIPGVRGFVQQTGWCRWLIYSTTGASLALSVIAESKYPLNYFIWILLTGHLSLIITLLSTYNDTEVPIQICALLATIFLAMIVYCSQNSLKYNKFYAMIASGMIAFMMSVFIQVALVIYDFSYVTCVGLSFLLSSYIHQMADVGMQKLTTADALRANFSLYTSGLKWMIAKFL